MIAIVKHERYGLAVVDSGLQLWGLLAAAAEAKDGACLGFEVTVHAQHCDSHELPVCQGWRPEGQEVVRRRKDG